MVTHREMAIVGNDDRDPVVAGGPARVGERTRGDASAVNRLVDQEKVADLQRALHAFCRNAKRLDEERSNVEVRPNAMMSDVVHSHAHRPLETGRRVFPSVRARSTAIDCREALDITDYDH